MKTWIFHFRQTLSELKRKPVSHLFTVGTVALSFLLAGLVIWVAESVKLAQNTWSSGTRISMFLERDLDPGEQSELMGEVRDLPGVKRVTLVEPEQARRELLEALGPDSARIVEIESGFFPAMLDVVVSGEPRAVRTSQNRLLAMAGVQKGISDVRVVDRWKLQFGNTLELAMLIAALLCGVVLLVSGWVLMSTTRSRVELQLEEMRVLTSLGASPGFIRTPLVMLSMLHGVLGVLFALGLLAGVLFLASPILELLLGPPAGDIRGFVLFDLHGIGVALAAALVTGWIAGRVALATVRVQTS